MRKLFESANLNETPNPAHALDGGIPRLFYIGQHWPAASDVRRWAKCETFQPSSLIRCI
jgi:hypothetical protein